MRLSPLAFFLAFEATAAAQSFIPQPDNLEVYMSEKFPGSQISYKQVNNLCETTEGVKSFSGYVSLPKDFVPDAAGWEDGVTGNFFFWYFEARNNPEKAPTSIYLGGGPGYTSFDGSSVFPCYINRDSNSTTLNEHSWNNHVNMLYIEQPLDVGFSYTTLFNGSYDTLTSTFTPIENEEDMPELNVTTLQATLPAGGPESMTNTTKAAARTLWRFAQVWFNEFPEYATENDEISIWAVSYGGFYAPIFTSYFLDQNALIEDKEHELANATTLNMATVGLINALVDAETMMMGMLHWAVNNTYNLPAYSEEIYETAVANVTDPDRGCFALLGQCRAAVAESDPDSEGTNQEVNEICGLAVQACMFTTAVYQEYSPYFWFDIALNKPASFPTEYETAFFNQPWVQEELGVPLNYTQGNSAVEKAFLGLTGDMARYDLSYLAHLLDSGVNVAMVYGDRDFRCNWISGQNASLHIPFDQADAFSQAGYEPITTNSSYEGGLVREHGKLSFSRVFQAGHSAGGYQPETMSAIFERAMLRRDVATGETDLSGDAATTYSSSGEMDITGITNELPEPIENICYVLQPNITCTEEQTAALADGTAETEDWVVTSPAGTKGERLTAEGGNGTEDGGPGDNNEGSGGGDGESFAVGLTVSFALLSVSALITL